jgi:hypothetical protein
MITTTKHQVDVQNAPKMLEWIASRGGIAVWKSQDLGNLGQGWTTPAKQENGEDMQPPTWQCKGQIPRVITDPEEIEVCIDKEVKRFHVAVRRGDGFSFRCTDASSRKVKQAVEKAGNGAYHVFDYSTQEAVIMIPVSVITLAQWAKDNGK